MTKLSNNVALVTGGGTGIGAAISRRLAREGARVWVTGHHAENINSVVQEIAAGGGNADARILDVRDSRATASIINDVVQVDGRLDILVANAARAGMRAYVGP